MALYRALRNLSSGVRVGALTALPGVSAADIAKLEQVGAVARVSAPPLKVFPAWRLRATVLAEHNIHDAEQLIEADRDVLASACAVTVEEFSQWQAEAADLLIHRKIESMY
jgi:hypothetical protein